MFHEFEVQLPSIPDREFDLRSFGAVSGGTVSNTEAFRKAVAAASENGGRIIVPDGIWLSGPIELRSNVELHLSDNSLILFSKNMEEYPLVITDFEGIRRIRTVSMLYAHHAENIAVTGNGTIDGNGHMWRPVKQFKLTERQWNHLLKLSSDTVIESSEGGIWVPSASILEGRYAGEVLPKSDTDEQALMAAKPYWDFYRPVMVSFRHCQKVLLQGVHLRNSPAWNLHPYFCEDFTAAHVSIHNPYWAQNGDGIDVDSCSRVHIHHCDLETGDDGICLKSGKDKEARAISGPCENVLIHHCSVGQSHGGFVVGSEMSRGIRNVLVRDCTFIDSDVGIRFKSAIGRGGTVENITMRNIQMVNIRNEAIVLSMDYVHNQMDQNDPVRITADPQDIPVFQDIHFEHCVCPDHNAVIRIEPLKDWPDSIHDVVFKDCIPGNHSC